MNPSPLDNEKIAQQLALAYDTVASSNLEELVKTALDAKDKEWEAKLRSMWNGTTAILVKGEISQETWEYANRLQAQIDCLSSQLAEKEKALSDREAVYEAMNDKHFKVNEQLRSLLIEAESALEPFANWDWSHSPMPSKFWDERAVKAKETLTRIRDRRKYR